MITIFKLLAQLVAIVFLWTRVGVEYILYFIMSKFYVTKGVVFLSTLGIFVGTLLLSSINFLAPIKPVLGIISIVIAIAAFFILISRQNEELKEDIREYKEDKKYDKDYDNNSDDNLSEMTEYDISQKIEEVMVGTRVYREEDEEKTPNYYLSTYYTINSFDSTTGEVDVTFTTPAGKSTEDLKKLLNPLLSSLQYVEGEEHFPYPVQQQGIIHYKLFKQVETANKPNFVTDTFIYEESFATNATINSIPFGIDEDGNQLTISAPENHTLIGGSSGGGKSVLSQNLILGMSNTNSILFGIDMKRGVELSLVADRFSFIATEPEEAAVLIEMLVDEMNRRYSIVRKAGLAKLSMNDPDNPPIQFIIDEAAMILDTAMFNTKEEKAIHARITAALKVLFQQARATGITIWLMTQSPKADIINTQLRNNFRTSAAMGTKDATQQKTILGDDGEGLPPVSANEKGTGYIVGDGFSPAVKFKSYFSTPELTKKIMKINKKNRPVLVPINNKWKHLDELRRLQFDNFLEEESNLGALSDDAVAALSPAEKLSDVINAINKDDFETILGYAQREGFDYRTLTNRFPDVQDLEAFAEAGMKKFNL